MLDAAWLTGSSVVSKLALSFSLQCVAFWTLCSVNSFSNCCRQQGVDPTVFVNMQNPPPPLENLIWIQLLVFALGLKKPQWGSPSGTKVCADVRGGWVGGLWTRRRRGRLGCSLAISGYGRREWSTLGQGLGVGNQRQSVLRKSGTADALALALTKIRTYQTPVDLVSFWFIICGYIRLVLCLGYGTYLRSSLS